MSLFHFDKKYSLQPSQNELAFDYFRLDYFGLDYLPPTQQ